MMNSKIKSCLLLTVGVIASFGAQEPPSKITVLVYNYAGVRFETLTQAKVEAARIYRAGKIEIRWEDCPLSSKQVGRFPGCQVPISPTKLVVRILSRCMEKCRNQDQNTVGFADSPQDGTFGTVANVFAYDADRLAEHRGIRHAVILGDVVAHEIGHLLLGSWSHSKTGIMHVPWRQKELQMAAQGVLRFSSEETMKMRLNISDRIARDASAYWGHREYPCTGISLAICAGL